MQRDSWMTEEADIFKASSREMKKSEAAKLNAAALRMEREAAKAVKVIPNKKYEFGDRGSGWRMMKLNKNDEIAAEEGRRPEDVALERYDSIEDYEEALREREFLQKSNKSESIRQKSSNRRDSFKDRSFRVPDKVTRTKDVKKEAKLEIEKPNERLKYVIKEQIEPILTRNELNLVFAKVIKATLTKSKDLSALKEEYDFQLRRTIESERAGNSSLIKPSFDEIRSLEPKPDHEKSLQDIVKEERISKSNLDNDLIKNIKNDKSYENDHDYIDCQSTQLASNSKSKERDYKKQRRGYRQAKDRLNELDECRFCLVDGVPSKLSVIAQGTRIYLALPLSIDMMPYHCLIIPKSHVQSSLDLDDDDWTEIRNFQKCITRMYDSIDKESLEHIEGDWTQHKPVINTNKGFRTSMVSNLPYFHVWLNINGGCGHIIEEPKEWPRWFGKVFECNQEVLASMLGIEDQVHLWRKPKDIDSRDVGPRVKRFLRVWKPFDWTILIEN